MVRNFRWCVVLAVCLTLNGVVQAQQAPVLQPNAHLTTRGMPDIPQALAQSLAAYADFRGFGFVDWHPTEGKMLVRHRETGAALPQLFELSGPGGTLTKLTDFSDSVRSAQYQPVRGHYLVYSRDKGGNEATQVFRFDLQSRQSTLLSRPDELTGFRWTHAGDRVLLAALPLDKTAAQGRRDTVLTRLSLVDPMDPAKARALTELAGGGWGNYRFSPDDKRLLAVLYRTPSDSAVHVIDLASGKVEQVFPRPGQSAAGVAAADWAADGRSIYLSTNQASDFNELAHMDLATGTVRTLSRHIPWDVEGLQVSPDGTKVLAVINNAGRDELRVFDTATGSDVLVPGIAPGSIGGGQWEPGTNQRFALSLNNAQSPGDVFSYDFKTQRLERWTTAHGDPRVNMAQFVTPELVQIRSFDGLTVSAWLYRPDAKKFPGKRPVVLDFHGGPEGQATVRFMGRWNYFVNEMGLALLLPNVRGSAGYGKKFMELDNGLLRKDSVKDGAAFLTWLETQPLLDAKRVAVTGGSYGGYMSLAMAVDYSDRLRSAVDVVGISHFVSFLNNTESYRRDLRRFEYGDERDPAVRAFMEKIAPLNNASAIRIPLFVVQGKNDPRVPYTEAEQIVAAVEKNKVPVWYLLADNEGHGFARKENADYYFYAQARFFQETLLK